MTIANRSLTVGVSLADLVCMRLVSYRRRAVRARKAPEALFAPNLTIAIILGAAVPNASTCGAATTKHDNMSTRSD
jgi:hypothetical protein